MKTVSSTGRTPENAPSRSHSYQKRRAFLPKSSITHDRIQHRLPQTYEKNQAHKQNRRGGHTSACENNAIRRKEPENTSLRHRFQDKTQAIPRKTQAKTPHPTGRGEGGVMRLTVETTTFDKRSPQTTPIAIEPYQKEHLFTPKTHTPGHPPKPLMTGNQSHSPR